MYILSGLNGPDFSPKSDFRTDSIWTARTLHGLARTSTSPCGLCTDSVQSVRSAQGPVGHCKLLDTNRLFKQSENMSDLDNDQLNYTIAVKLDALYKLLDISPYNN